MSSHLAVRLLKPNTDCIAQVVARQIRRTVPRYEQVESVALERNVRTVIKGVIRLLKRGDHATLLRTIEDIAQLKSSTPLPKTSSIAVWTSPAPSTAK